MSQPIISVRDISKVYRLGEIGATSLREESARAWRKFRGKKPLNDGGDFWALNGVSFDVEQGEVVGIIGKNGAGKSTLLKILSRITEPSGGEIRLRGRVAALLEVGTGFHPELTGRENIYLNGTILGMKKREIDTKLDEIIDFSGIEKHIDTPVKRYSSGMNVRLGFAVAAHLEPEILIVDEVLAVGDAEFQKKCIEKMQDVASEGKTILFVSHNLASISRLTNRCLIIEGGGKEFDGPTDTAVPHYLDACRAVTSFQNVNFSKLPRLPIGNGAAKFTTLRFEKSNPVFNVNEDINIILELKTEQAVSNLRFSLTILSEDMTPVGSTCTDVGKIIKAGASNNYKVTLPSPTLAPGNYSCTAALGAGSHFEKRTPFDVVPNVMHFTIESQLAASGVVIEWPNQWGRIVMPYMTFANDKV